MAVATAAGKYVAYISVPISPRGGGHFKTNNAIAAQAASRLTARFGDRLYVLNPAAYDLPNVGGSSASGGDYMAVWSDVIGGANGEGEVFDIVYFSGPADVRSFFGLTGSDDLGAIARWLDAKALSDADYKSIADNPTKRRDFIRYYGLRASSAYSKGAHDEWNIVTKLNRSRETGNDIAVLFDGQPIEPGDFEDVVDRGYEIDCP